MMEVQDISLTIKLLAYGKHGPLFVEEMTKVRRPTIKAAPRLFPPDDARKLEKFSAVCHH